MPVPGGFSLTGIYSSVIRRPEVADITVKFNRHAHDSTPRSNDRITKCDDYQVKSASEPKRVFCMTSMKDSNTSNASYNIQITGKVISTKID